MKKFDEENGIHPPTIGPYPLTQLLFHLGSATSPVSTMRGATLTGSIALVFGCCVSQAFLVPRPGKGRELEDCQCRWFRHQDPCLGLEGLSVYVSRDDDLHITKLVVTESALA